MFAKKALVAVKMEGTYATDPTIAGTDAFLVKNLRLTPMQAEYVKRQLVRAYLGNDEELPAGIYVQVEFEVELAGSGTPAIAPKWGRCMRACACSETLTAADVTGTATAGTTRSITLAVGASAVDGFYNGMPLDVTAGSNVGFPNLVTAYNGTTKVASLAKTAGGAYGATSVYAIRSNAQYRPISATFESVAFLTNYDGTQHKALGARGTWSAMLNARGIPSIKFTLLGLYQTVADVVLPTPDYSAFQRGFIANSQNTPVFYLHDVSPVVESFSMDLGGAATFIQRIGSERVDFNDRAPTGKLAFEAVPVATKDWWTTAKNGTTDSLALVHGITAGNRSALVAPNVQVKPPAYSEDKNTLMKNLDLVMVPGYLSGNDDFYVTTY